MSVRADWILFNHAAKQFDNNGVNRVRRENLLPPDAFFREAIRFLKELA
jgi:hypothetical protein